MSQREPLNVSASRERKKQTLRYETTHHEKERDFGVVSYRLFLFRDSAHPGVKECIHQWHFSLLLKKKKRERTPWWIHLLTTWVSSSLPFSSLKGKEKEKKKKHKL